MFLGTIGQGAEMPTPGVQSQMLGKSGGNKFQGELYDDFENNGMIGVYSDTDGVTVWGSLQCPYYVHKALMHAFGLPGVLVAEEIRRSFPSHRVPPTAAPSTSASD